MIQQVLLASLSTLSSEEFIRCLIQSTPLDQLKPDEFKILKGYLSTITQEEYTSLRSMIHTTKLEDILLFINQNNPDLFDTIETLITEHIPPNPLDYIRMLCMQFGRLLLTYQPITH